MADAPERVGLELIREDVGERPEEDQWTCYEVTVDPDDFKCVGIDVYVRADIADRHKRERDTLLEDLRHITLCNHDDPAAMLTIAEAAIAECEPEPTP